MTMIETIIVMIIAVAALSAGGALYADYLTNSAHKATAIQMESVSETFGRYLEDNHNTLLVEVTAQGGLWKKDDPGIVCSWSGWSHLDGDEGFEDDYRLYCDGGTLRAFHRKMDPTPIF